ncbi:hypothetical protein D3C80_1077780 [compost metagenome]
MPVQYTPGRVGNRVLLVIAFGQYRVKRRNRATARFGITGPLHQLGQLGENRRRVALGGRRLADGQGDLALSLGKTRQRVHQQQDVLALVAKVFGDACAIHGRAQAHQRRIVGR